MDRIVNVRLFKVERLEGTATPFSDALRSIRAQTLGEREWRPTADIFVRLESLAVDQRLLMGEMIRLQSNNLPPKALAGVPKSNLGIASIGHSVAFVYDPEQGILALQQQRNGVTSARFAAYVESFHNRCRYDILPILSQDVWVQLQRGRIRAVTMRVANPTTLQPSDDVGKSVARGFRDLKAVLEAADVEVTMAMRQGDGDMDRDRAIGLFRWVQRQREEERGEVLKLSAKVTPPDGTRADPLDLIDGQMGRKRTLDLPDDDPDASLQIRLEFVREVLDEHGPELRHRYR